MTTISGAASAVPQAPTDDAPKLTCYAFNEYPQKIVPAPADRAWMDAFPDRHPYRCLPLTIANAYGWHVLCPAPIEIEWNGGPKVTDMAIRVLKPLPGGRPPHTLCSSHFSRGIFTFHLDYLFRTSPGWDLMTTGAANWMKDNAHPLTGIVETEWLSYPFSQSWQVMRPGKVVFEEDEPICALVPVQKNMLVACEPEIFRLSENPALANQAAAFRTERNAFQGKLNQRDAEALKQAWMKRYFHGELPDGTTAPNHITKLRLKEPVDRRQTQYGMTPYRVNVTVG